MSRGRAMRVSLALGSWEFRPTFQELRARSLTRPRETGSIRRALRAPTIRLMTPTFFVSPAKFRKWLEKNHERATELLVGFYKKGSGKPSISWQESVDQALSFGWIDGGRARIADPTHSMRFH